MTAAGARPRKEPAGGDSRRGRRAPEPELEPAAVAEGGESE